MKRVWHVIKCLTEGFLMSLLALSIMGDLMKSDVRWVIIGIIFAGSFIADGIDEAFDE